MSLATKIGKHDWTFLDGKLQIHCSECGSKNGSHYNLNREHGTLDLLCYDCGIDLRVALEDWVKPPAEAAS